MQDGLSLPDEDGRELPDLDAAKREAVLLAGALIRELGASFWTAEEWRICVTNHDRRPLFTLRFSGSTDDSRSPCDPIFEPPRPD